MSFDKQKALSFLDSGETFDREKASAFLEEKTNIERPDNQVLPSSLQIPGGYPDDIREKLLEQSGQPEAPQAPEQTAWQEAGQLPSEFNAQIVSLLGIPGDLWNMTASAFNAEDQMGHGWGSDEARQLAADLNISYSGPPQDTAATKIGSYAALGLTFLAPMLRIGAGAAKALPSGKMVSTLSPVKNVKSGKDVNKITGAFEGVAQRIAAPFFAKPKIAFGGELIGSVGAGTGAFYGGEEYGQTGEMIGGLLGGFVPQMSLMAIPRLAESGTKQLFPYTQKGGTMKVGERLRSLAETEQIPNTINRQLKRVLPNINIPPAKLAGDRHILALHYKLLEGDAPLQHQFKMDETRINAMVREEMEKLGGGVPIEETQAWLQGRVDHIKTLLNKNLDKSLQSAKESLNNLSPVMMRKTVNVETNRLVNKAYDDAKIIERGEWAKVDKGISTTTDSVRVAYGDELVNRAQNRAAKRLDIPEYVEDMLGRVDNGQYKQGKIGKNATIDELQTFRSNLLDEVRAERSLDAPNRNKIRILGDLQRAILSDMEKAQGPGLKEALQITRINNDKFNGGIMDVIFGHSRTGGRVAPELSLESINPGSLKGGPKAAMEIQKILEVAPQSYNHLENLVKLQIASSSVITSEQRINISSAKRYLKNNEDVIKIFPQLLDDMNYAIGLEERAVGLRQTTKQRMKNINTSTAARLSGLKPGQVLSDILTSPYPEMEMKKFLSQSNSVGKEGIRNDITEYLLNKSITKKMDEFNKPLLSGVNLINEWNKNKNVFKYGLNRSQVHRLLLLTNTLIKNEGLKDLPDIGMAVPPTNKLISFVVGLAGTKAGAWSAGKTSGAALKTASMGSKVATDFAKNLETGMQIRLLKDAIHDPVLFNALMADTTKPPQILKATKAIQAWMLSVAIDSLETQ